MYIVALRSFLTWSLFYSVLYNNNIIVYVYFQVPGRLFPIQLHYKPILIDDKPTRDDRLDPQPYVQVMQLIDSKYPREYL